VEDSLSVTNANAVTWGVGRVDNRCSRCADPAAPVERTVAEMVKLVKPATTRSAPRFVR